MTTEQQKKNIVDKNNKVEKKVRRAMIIAKRVLRDETIEYKVSDVIAEAALVIRSGSE